jgi:hypothetical protein
LPAAGERRITHLSDFLDNFLRLCGRELQLARDLDAVLYGTGDGAKVCIEAEHSLYLLAVLLFRSEMESLLYPLDNEDFAFGLYLPHRVGVEIVKRNLTRCQRAPEGAEQSPTRCGYQVV